MSSHGTEVIRESDGALMGYVQRAGNGDWSPRTVFGHHLGSARPHEDAIAEVERRGLACLAERWWYRDETDGEWYACVILEATASRVHVQITDVNHPNVYSRLAIDNPTAETLRP